MKYYKTVVDGFIVSISTGGGQTEVSEEEYNALMAVIMSAPPDPDGFAYMLRNETLEWELVELPPVPPDPDPDLDDSESLEILLGGAT